MVAMESTASYWKPLYNVLEYSGLNDFDVLKALDEADFICLGTHPSRTKSVYLTASGLEYGKKLMEKYGIQDRGNTAE